MPIPHPCQSSRFLHRRCSKSLSVIAKNWQLEVPSLEGKNRQHEPEYKASNRDHEGGGV